MSDSPTSSAVHIVLSTLPQGQEKKFHDSMIDKFYGTYRAKMEENFVENGIAPFYKPVSYFLFGNYDVAYISLINDFKFAHRLVDPLSEQTDPFKPYASQSFIGTTSCDLDENSCVLDMEKLIMENKFFIGICNLKINNGILVGNGVSLIQEITQKLESIVRNNKRIKLFHFRSYSWFEITCLVFSSEINDIFDFITDTRRLVFSDLPSFGIFRRRSLYGKSDGVIDENIQQASVFSDSQTYFGVNSYLIECLPDHPFLKAFMKKQRKLKTLIEWQVKPGHMKRLTKILFSEEIHKFIKFDKERVMLVGKSDYCLEDVSSDIRGNVRLLRMMHSDKFELHNHIRRMRTRLFYKGNSGFEFPPDRDYISLDARLRSMAVPLNSVSRIDISLKSLKISRQIRKKVIKVITNYNSSIQDPILFPYFLEFNQFIKNLILHIKDKIEITKSDRVGSPMPLAQAESDLCSWIEDFQEGYNIRILNGYQFEDINDFDLDFNSSVQQLLSAYSAIAYRIGNDLYRSDIKYGPIVRINYKDTVANYNSINYAVHHLTAPEFVFTTLIKEVMNKLGEDSIEFKKARNIYYTNFETIKNKVDSTLFEDIHKNGQFKFDYFIIDSAMFCTSFDCNFELFNYWFWAYNLQNSALYNNSGILNEDHFKKEMLRLFLIKSCFKDDSKLECPILELAVYWNRYFKPLNEISKRLILEFRTYGILNLHKSIIKHMVSNMLDSMPRVRNSTNSQEIIKIFDIYKKQWRFNGADISKVETLFTEIYKKKILAKKIINSGNIEDIFNVKQSYYGNAHGFLYYRMLKNHGKHYTVKRNWSNGEPLKIFMGDSEIRDFWHLDQLGGVFFTSKDTQSDYMRDIIACLNYVLDYSSEIKLKQLTEI